MKGDEERSEGEGRGEEDEERSVGEGRGEEDEEGERRLVVGDVVDNYLLATRK